MSQDFVKGRTNNHLTFMMCDATDFATPESALSAATKIKIYGKVRGGTGVNFVSSGTGSLTNDIQHVGASALGIYTIALVKADLSDASNAWYDQYIISLSATGAAYQTLVVDGGIDASALSAYQSRFSDIQSYLVALSAIISDAHSAAILGASNASDAHSAANVGNSRMLLVQSDTSDLLSRTTTYISDMSDVLSRATQINSRVALVQSNVSDVESQIDAGVPLDASTMSDLRSAITATELDASDLSDIASAVRTIVSSDLSDIISAVAVGNSRVLLVQSRLSDLDSRLVSDLSDTLSGVRSLRSAIIGHEGSTASATGNASTLEIDGIDHANQFNGYWVKLLGGSQVDELRLVVATDLTNSRITVKPAFNSAVASGIDFVLLPGSPYLSNIHSDLRSYMVGLSGAVSDAHSAAILGASNASDAYSAALLAQSLASDAHSAAAQANSRVLLNQSRISDIQSFLSDFQSDLISHLDTTGVGLNASTMSDLRSAINAITVSLDASNISDIASAVVAALPITSMVSDIYSLLSDLHSDFQSRVPKRVATDSQLSDMASDIKSAVAVGNSRALLNQSSVSDIYSLLSDLHSDVGVVSGVVSDVYSLVTAGVEVGASSLSDLRSAITANGMQVAGADPTAVIGVTDTLAAKMNWLAAMSRNKLTQTATKQTLLADNGTTVVASAVVSDDGGTATRGEFG